MRITHDTPCCPSSFTLTYAESGAVVIADRIANGLQFRCVRYCEQVTADACRMMEWPLCRECATGARIRQ